jgi:membrane-bound lytic murein transglycosylase D
MLRALNPSYRRDVVPGATELSAIRLPLADTGRFIDMEDSIFSARNDELIGKRLEVEIAADLAPATTVKATKRGRVAKASKKKKSRKATSSGRGGRSVTVKRGQTLSEIARRNGTTVAKLKKLNGIRGNNIQAGKKLKVK